VPLIAAPVELVVTEAGRGSRLDQFVQRELGRAGGDAPPTRGEVQRWIGLGAVSVNGAVRKPSELLRSGDLVAVTRPPEARTDAVAEAGVVFDVVYADDALVVVNKPAGLVVHPAKGHPGGTLVNGLLARGYFDEGEEGLADPRDAEGHRRPGIVHRIDKGTSGLLVVARTSAAREGLKKQLALHTVLREYDAIALCDVTLTEHDTLHGRHPTDRLRFTGRVREGKRAVTFVRVVERFGVATYVRCTLRTGRTHQIRVHLAESGTPILGDSLYGSAPRDAKLARIGRTLGHPALHARLLGFTHPTTGEALRFEAPLPADFAAALEALAGGPVLARGD
jgi:23S rRNA pseudouridine1911/1915/1917 synthase